MSNATNQPEIKVVWTEFIVSIESLLVTQIDDRPLDQYHEYRDIVLKLAKGEKFLNELDEEWNRIVPDTQTSQIDEEIRNTLGMEMQAFSRAVKIAKETTKPKKLKTLLKKLLKKAKPIPGSVKDIVDSLPPYAKGVLTLVDELIDIFSGKD